MLLTKCTIIEKEKEEEKEGKERQNTFE